MNELGILGNSLPGQHKQAILEMNTREQTRLFITIRKRLGDGGHFGWDWMTAHIIHPHLTKALAYMATRQRRNG